MYSQFGWRVLVFQVGGFSISHAPLSTPYDAPPEFGHAGLEDDDWGDEPFLANAMDLPKGRRIG
jgi:hypothetical protein